MSELEYHMLLLCWGPPLMLIFSRIHKGGNYRTFFFHSTHRIQHFSSRHPMGKNCTLSPLKLFFDTPPCWYLAYMQFLATQTAFNALQRRAIFENFNVGKIGHISKLHFGYHGIIWIETKSNPFTTQKYCLLAIFSIDSMLLEQYLLCKPYLYIFRLNVGHVEIPADRRTDRKAKHTSIDWKMINRSVVDE